MCPLDLSDGFAHNVPLRITLIGCGKMGAAMMQSWIASGLIEYAEVLDPQAPDELITQHSNIDHVTELSDLSLDKTQAIILATKPQIMDDICGELKGLIPQGVAVISVAAGKNTAYFQKNLGEDTPIIRAMPNTPAAANKGMTALFTAENTDDAYRNIAQSLMSAIGQTLWIEDEQQMDAITAVSGSGPAYLFHLIEVLAQAGEKAGLSAENAMVLARQTIIGAACLADNTPEITAETLRENVTSPKGTTEAALNILMDGRLQSLFDEAIKAAKTRSQKLSS